MNCGRMTVSLAAWTDREQKDLLRFTDFLSKVILSKRMHPPPNFCKLVENSFRDVNIAFANEISMLCDQLQISSTELIGLANRHPRVDILNPGIGVGGHCIAIDPLFVASMFPKDTMMIQSARAVNRKKTAWVIDRVLQEVEQYEVLRGKRACVTLLGLSYKQDVGDLRSHQHLRSPTHSRQKGWKLLALTPMWIVWKACISSTWRQHSPDLISSSLWSGMLNSLNLSFKSMRYQCFLISVIWTLAPQTLC